VVRGYLLALGLYSRNIKNNAFANQLKILPPKQSRFSLAHGHMDKQKTRMCVGEWPLHNMVIALVIWAHLPAYNAYNRACVAIVNTPR
jgi:hypothetical protein